mmetsp:Transcript_19603/g.49822  ORF Transcript_19603/g.49822 Transcript_19603/m.49822 type:complete len:202 (+) Transcript_19603:572-1177(+)
MRTLRSPAAMAPSTSRDRAWNTWVPSLRNSNREGRCSLMLPGVSVKMSTGSTLPDALPNSTSAPRGARLLRLVSQVAAPTPSYATATPRPPVISLTRCTTSCCVYRMTASAPSSLASSAFSGVDTVPMTRPPRFFAICVSSWPVPPAAACTSTQSPGCMSYASVASAWAVRPCTMPAAAASYDTPAGMCAVVAASTRVSSA